MLSTTLSTPIFCAASAVRPTPITPAAVRPMRRATLRLRLPLRAGTRVKRLQAPRRCGRQPVGGPDAGPVGDALDPFAGAGASIARS